MSLLTDKSFRKYNMHKIFELRDMDMEQLHTLASELNIKGSKKMDKDALVYAILDEEARHNAHNAPEKPVKAKRGRPKKSDSTPKEKPVEDAAQEPLDKKIVKLSKELKENSCEYNIVMQHEKTHQQINKKTLEYYLPLFKSASTTIIKSIKPVSIKNADRGY